MTSSGERDATRQRILVAAARALAAREAGSMGEIAAAAGVARGTLYRYFPTRESLMAALESAATQEAAQRLAQAGLDGVPLEEGLARATRALVAVGEHFIVLLRERRPPEPSFAAPLISLVQRGVDAGQLRADVPLPILVEGLLVVVGVCVRAGDAHGLSSEDVSALALRLFLGGARVDSAA